MTIEKLRYDIQRKKFEDECTSEGTILKNFDLYKKNRTNVIITIVSFMLLMFALGLVYGVFI